MSHVLRKRARVCYYEPEEPSFDQHIFCSSCGDYVYEYCSIHGPLLVIPDDKVPSPTGFPPLVPRAALTIPRVFLHLAASTIPGADIGVFSTLTLPCGVRFGPYRGVRTNNPSSAYCWQLYDRDHRPTHAVDARDPDRSNWMRYVNCSRHSSEQNLIAFQYQGQLYYRTIRIVPRFTELLVFYGSEYARALKIDLSRYNAPAGYTQMIEIEIEPEIHVKTENDEWEYNTNYPAAYETENICKFEQDETEEIKIEAENHVKTENDGWEYNTNYSAADNETEQKKKHDANKVLTIPEVSEQAPSKYDSNDTKRKPQNEIFICDYCRKAFKEKALLIPHIASHSNVEALKIDANSSRLLKFPCATCNTKFGTKSELINHEIKTHDSKVNYKACDTCDYKTVRSSALKRHILTHSGVKPYQCTVCNLKFNGNSKLKDHQRVHTGEKPYVCTVCNSRFSKNSNLITHQRTHTKEKPYICLYCEAKFTRSGHLKRHIKIHTAEKPYTCTMCDSKFTSSSHLTRHIKIHTAEKTYTCTVCDTKFTRSNHLTRHLRIHTGEKPYTCTVCEARFTRSNHLTRHFRIHTGEKPYACTVCDTRFTNSKNLRRHLNSHTEEKPYTCTVCDLKFTSSCLLTRHTRIHTAEKPYTCTVCDTNFTRSYHLTRHLKIHTGEKPYTCTVCEKKFTRMFALKKHSSTHGPM